MKRYFLLLGVVAFLMSLASCFPQVVKTDLPNLLANPEKFQGKEVIVTADLKSVLESPGDYRGRKIELSGYVDYRGWRGFRAWHFFLIDKEGRKARCYEKVYRVEGWIVPIVTVKRAAREQKLLTVVGKLEKSMNIELDYIEYEGRHIDTDTKPSHFANGF